MQPVNITFGMIVLNGEPFLRYNLQALYPFAHQIIVVEGAVPDAKRIARPDGHSRDATLQVLRDFKAAHDPKEKLTIVTAEGEGHPNGFWPGEKDEQSRAYAKRTTGEYLWQVDADEFYQPDDLAVILRMLAENPRITAVSFPMITFWGGLDYWVDGWYLRRGASVYHRLFKWGAGYSYLAHRPPTVLDDAGRDTRQLCWIQARQLARRGIFLYHYSLLLPHQVEEKIIYYEDAEWSKRAGAAEWLRDSFYSLRKPYRVHNVYQYPSWLRRYQGAHPPAVRAMMKDLRNSRLPMKVRRTDDIDRLLADRFYAIGKLVLMVFDYPDRIRVWIISVLKAFLRKPYREVKSFLTGKRVFRAERKP